MADPLSLFLIMMFCSLRNDPRAWISGEGRLFFSLRILRFETSLKISWILLVIGWGISAGGGVQELLGINGSLSPLKFLL